MDRKEAAIQESEKGNAQLMERLNKVKTLLKNKQEKDIEVPIMCSHIEQIKVYENRLDVYLDFLNNQKFISANYDKNGKNGVYDMPICRGRKLSR